jgi:pimeloyl-ACP methyl ester carboxylesterase
MGAVSPSVDSGPTPGHVPARTVVVDSGDVALNATLHTATDLPDDAPVVVAVHGYPDTQRLWDPVVSELAPDHLVLTYDVRGAGLSGRPSATRGYRAACLVDDLVAVLDTVLPDRRPVHLLGHDWGSVQLWDAVCAEATDPRLQARIASFTSISGPSLDHVAAFVRHAPVAQVRAQQRRSRYVLALHVPVLPELAWRHLAGPLRRRLARVEGLPQVDGPAGHWEETLGADGARGAGLYRANVRRRMRDPGPGRTRVPVLVVMPRQDRFLTPALLRWASTAGPVECVEVEGGHWLPRTSPQLVAELVRTSIHRSGEPR